MFECTGTYSCGYCFDNICVACSLNEGLPDPSMLDEEEEAFCCVKHRKKYYLTTERQENRQKVKRNAKWQKPGAHEAVEVENVTLAYLKTYYKLPDSFTYEGTKYNMPKEWTAQQIDCFFDSAQSDIAKSSGNGPKSTWDLMIKRIEPDFTQWPGVKDYDDVCSTDDNASDNTSDAPDKTDSGDDAGDESESESNDAGDESESDGKDAGKKKYVDFDTLILRQDSDLSEEGFKMEGKKRPNKAPKRQKKDKKAPKRHKK